MSDSSREDRPPEETYEALMRATYAALCEHGYADLTLRKIADEFEKSRGLVHYHYDSKDHLIVSLLEYLSERFADRIEATSEDPPAERLETLLEWLTVGPSFEGMTGRDYHTAIFELRAQAPYNEGIRAQLQRNFAFIEATCESIIREGIREGTFRPVDVETTAALVVHAVTSARNTQLTIDRDDAVDTVREALEQFVFPQLYDRRPPDRPD